MTDESGTSATVITDERNVVESFQKDNESPEDSGKKLVKVNIRGSSQNLRDPPRAEFRIRLGDHITQFFTKENADSWFKHFDLLCIRNGLRTDEEKIDALVICLESSIFLSV